MYALFKMELLKTIQDRGLYFWTFVLPILFTVLFIAVLTSGAEPETEEIIIHSIIPGYTVMFVFFIIIAMTTSFIKDRDEGLVARLASTPLQPYAYLLGKWTPYLIIVCIQIVVLFSFGKIVYNIPIEQPLQLVIISILLTFTVTGIGLAISVSIKTNNMGIAITQVLALGGALLGGLWMPVEMMPNLLQTVSNFLPQYWSHQALIEAMAGSLTYKAFFKASSILFGFGLIGFIIALFRYPHFLKIAQN